MGPSWKGQGQVGRRGSVSTWVLAQVTWKLTDTGQLCTGGVVLGCWVMPRNSQVEAAGWAHPSPKPETRVLRVRPPRSGCELGVQEARLSLGDKPSTQDSLGSQRKERDSRGRGVLVYVQDRACGDHLAGGAINPRGGGSI